MPTMLILRGNPGRHPWKGVEDWPKGALDEPPALEYAKKRGYTGRVLDIAGYSGAGSKQYKLAMAEIDKDDSITGLYGFSAGGYNVYWIIQGMTAEQRQRLKLVVVIGAPQRSKKDVSGKWELVYLADAPKERGDHMGGPQMVLEDWDKSQKK